MGIHPFIHSLYNVICNQVAVILYTAGILGWGLAVSNIWLLPSLNEECCRTCVPSVLYSHITVECSALPVGIFSDFLQTQFCAVKHPLKWIPCVCVSVCVQSPGAAQADQGAVGGQDTDLAWRTQRNAPVAFVSKFYAWNWLREMKNLCIWNLTFLSWKI